VGIAAPAWQIAYSTILAVVGVAISSACTWRTDLCCPRCLGRISRTSQQAGYCSMILSMYTFRIGSPTGFVLRLSQWAFVSRGAHRSDSARRVFSFPTSQRQKHGGVRASSLMPHRASYQCSYYACRPVAGKLRWQAFVRRVWVSTVAPKSNLRLFQPPVIRSSSDVNRHGVSLQTSSPGRIMDTTQDRRLVTT
jgi:hypothetical protein